MPCYRNSRSLSSGRVESAGPAEADMRRSGTSGRDSIDHSRKQDELTQNETDEQHLSQSQENALTALLSGMPKTEAAAGRGSQSLHGVSLVR
jgi:hypothetical protein